MSAVIIGTGHDLPEQVVTNDELEAMGVGYDRARAGGKSLDEWVMARTGVHLRHRARLGVEGSSDFGTRAAQKALAMAGLKGSDLDLIIMSTYTSDHRAPNSAAIMQDNLDATCKFLQLDGACPGFVDAVILADAMMQFMNVHTALVVSSDITTLYCLPTDFMMMTTFGDGAGAAVLRREPGSPYGVKAHVTGTKGSIGKALWVPGGGTKEPPSFEVLAQGRQYAQWSHKETYAFATEKLAEGIVQVAERAGWSLDEVKWYIPHQAGRNIALDAARNVGQPAEKFIINIDHTGNTSGASIPIAMDEANRAGRFADGDKIILSAMGAGLAWGAVALVWYDPARAAAEGKHP
ncbi:MAG: beta-ketoacyl-ACP synthase 3 [Chloroflexi bacterium]|nr:beta-ketoacyl-ACP synthase 3 [Chloroflexota bacterium]MBI5293631.1 beta-ketoacyl-ACP synthase 3 [Chloroflexota bacterium]